MRVSKFKGKPPPTTSKNIKEAKDVQALVRNFMNINLHQLSSSNSFWPVFVSMIAVDPEGQISCTHSQIKVQDLSFPTSTHTGNLELIWSVKRAKNRGICTAGWNPAWAERRFCLGNLHNSNFCETLGHENTSKYLSNHAPKVERKHPLVLLLTGQKRSKILLTG